MSYQYFWPLDAELGLDIVSGYQAALGPKNASQHLVKLTQVLGKRIPISPQAFITPRLGKRAGMPIHSREILAELGTTLERMERITHCQFGGTQYPLLLSVHGDFCGTIRNIGITSRNLHAFVHQYGKAQAFRIYIDFLESFSSLALRCPFTDFMETFHMSADRTGASAALSELLEGEFLEKVREYQAIISKKIGAPFPEKPENQLFKALLYCSKASVETGDEVFIRVQKYRSVYGQSVHGSVYTRNPFTGDRRVYGTYQFGEDGSKGPIDGEEENASLRNRFPGIHSILKKHLPNIEAAFADVIEAEFVTDEDGSVFFTSFDKAETTSRAAIVAAIDLNQKGFLSDGQAALRIKPADVEMLLHATLTDDSRKNLEDLGSEGVTAAPGTAIGRVFFKMNDAIEYYKAAIKNKESPNAILVCDELLIGDSPGLSMISGLVTKAAGIASHAAVMARANGIPCMVGYKGLELDLEQNCMVINGKKIKAGTPVTLEAAMVGKLYLGEGKLQNLSFEEGVLKSVSQLISRIVGAEKITQKVYVNINNSKDAQNGLQFGADGVGLCRTENMFIKSEVLWEIRNIVFSKDTKACSESFRKLEEFQFDDYKKIFAVMAHRTVNIRLMDMPLHELVPKSEAEFKELEKKLPHLESEQLRITAEGFREHNPMLGLRACRFGVVFPEIHAMQIRAIVRAAYAVSKSGVEVNPGIMFPLVFTKNELLRMKNLVHKVEREVRDEIKISAGSRVNFRVGTMIELPAAALEAHRLAEVGEFFAFGTNDLTQTTLGISRDDSAHYLPTYIENQILDRDPFKMLSEPVQELIEIATLRARRVRQDAQLGICGEQGGDPTTLGFIVEKGLDYISCSPFRVLPARLALVHTCLERQALQEMARAGSKSIAQLSA